MSTETKYPYFNLEMWGGPECTINRVGGAWRDQLAESRHYQRPDDISAFASLGIKKIRYPILWEKHLPGIDGQIDWHWANEQLSCIRANNITPIAGLLHHGSGPGHTNLSDRAFPEKLASYAAKVAKQFPWLEYYTPVNEPLTTARFSGLYGFWYPHYNDEKSFLHMLLNQVKGTVLSMKAIRDINPQAKLVQTEDLCKVHSTPLLAYQANFENERRWLTYDLLCGRVRPGHALWNHLLFAGITETELLFFCANPCPPDIMGFNYYITSERWLDEDLHHYPVHLHGGNGRHQYVDTDAARTDHRQGVAVLLREAWERFRLPMAITECHLSCTREEQMRWFNEIWHECKGLRKEGIAVRAVTAWSLLGAFDWDSLMVQQNRRYESGVFDTSGGDLRPTLMVKMIRKLSSGRSFHHPLLETAGWWKKSPPPLAGSSTPHLVIIGSDDVLNGRFERLCRERNIPCQLFPDGSKNLEIGVVWALVLTVKSINDLKFGDCKAIITLSKKHELPLMVVTSSGLDENTADFLTIHLGKGDGMKIAHHAMDLFIDGESGNWQLDERGAAKPDTAALALF